MDHRHDEESRNGREVKIDIGRLYTDTGMVPKKIGDFSEYWEVTGTPGKVNGPYGP